MALIKCPDCGAQYAANLQACPQCGCPNDHVAKETNNALDSHEPILSGKEEECKKATLWDEFTSGDWAHYLYECALLGWHTYSRRFAQFSGRATRREYWSFSLVYGLMLPYLVLILYALIPLATIIGVTLKSAIVTGFLVAIVVIAYCVFLLVPALAVGVRRMHDAGKNGWWILVPVASFFLTLKRSDADYNKYGAPPIDDI